MAFLACSSDSGDCKIGPVENPNQQAVIDSTAYRQSGRDCRLPRVQTFKVFNFSFSEIVADQGTVLMVTPKTFSTPDGTLVDGEVTLSLIEMYQPGEIIACQLSTNGLNQNQKVEPLLSESIFYLNATYNGEPVIFNQSIQVFVPSENQNLELSLFHSPSCPQLECTVLWEIEQQGTIFEKPYTNASGDTVLGYRAFVQNTGWRSIARFNENQTPRGTLYNKAKPGYNTSNSNTFLYYDASSTAIGMFTSFDTENEVFSEQYGEIPNNTPGEVIFVGKPETEFMFGSSAVITKDGKITVTRDLQSGSETSLIAYINNL
ncbi:hypothetical protein DDV96_10405 [Marixanthomonas spongiae]|uniref:Uncharacterized protein n=2 Tax=Marixanthomonas spongiae TaxID=2174845 RepID=A0A2U0HZA4_9FLAO|nr:hypothetical protein DDV96_10405 [Marixanthomonas spongiae]